MAIYNHVTLMGRLTATPDAPIRTQNGFTICTIRLVVGKSKKNPQTGQWENDPNPLYIDCKTFDNANSKYPMSERVAKLTKGDEVLVDGELKLESWDDKNSGQKRQKHTLAVSNLVITRTKNGEGGGGGQQQQPQRQQQPQYSGGDGGYDDGGSSSDDIPF